MLCRSGEWGASTLLLSRLVMQIYELWDRVLQRNYEYILVRQNLWMYSTERLGRKEGWCTIKSELKEDFTLKFLNHAFIFLQFLLSRDLRTGMYVL